jgi:hypothetical protein
MNRIQRIASSFFLFFFASRPAGLGHWLCMMPLQQTAIEIGGSIFARFTTPAARSVISRVRDDHDVMLQNVSQGLIFSTGRRQQRQWNDKLHLQTLLLKLTWKRVHAVAAVLVSVA